MATMRLRQHNRSLKSIKHTTNSLLHHHGLISSRNIIHRCKITMPPWWLCRSLRNHTLSMRNRSTIQSAPISLRVQEQQLLHL